jgi:hypothetical protein
LREHINFVRRRLTASATGNGGPQPV